MLTINPYFKFVHRVIIYRKLDLNGYPKHAAISVSPPSRCDLKVELPAMERYLNGLNKENLPITCRAVQTDTLSEALGTYTDSVVHGGRPSPINDEERSMIRCRNCQILIPIARRSPKLEPKENFAEVILYDTKLLYKLN